MKGWYFFLISLRDRPALQSVVGLRGHIFFFFLSLWTFWIKILKFNLSLTEFFSFYTKGHKCLTATSESSIVTLFSSRTEMTLCEFSLRPYYGWIFTCGNTFQPSWTVPCWYGTNRVGPVECERNSLAGLRAGPCFSPYLRFSLPVSH